jgi:SAM-dependent methyltransferase
MVAAKTIPIGDDRRFPSFSLDEVHYKVMSLIDPLPSGRALDMPAGPGRLSWWLHNRGFNVIAGDIMPENFANPEIPIVTVDVNHSFPFADSTFDYAFCIDGPEHFENLYHVFREFARILKTGGKLIISYPNYSNLESRLRNIFYGVLEPVTSRQQLSTRFSDNPGMVHVNRSAYPLLKMALDFAGFTVDRITSEKCKRNQLLFMPLYLLIRMFTRFKGDKGDVKYGLKESNSYSVLMGGNDIILVTTIHK